MNKKKIIVILITFLTLSILSNVYLLYSNYSLRNILFQEQSSSTPKKKDLMSLMLETEQGSGMYEASKTGEWPDGEYVFNKELSKCENGGELSWDNEKNQVVMVGNSSDKCYLYFNIDTSVTINSFTVTNTETTITISMDAQSTNGAIAKYYYSIDDGNDSVSILASRIVVENGQEIFKDLENEEERQVAYELFSETYKKIKSTM